MKVLTLGNGFIADHLPYEKYTKKLPIDSGLTFEERVIDKYRPDVVINCIGKTGRPNVDWCEKNKEETVLINTALPIVLADACARHSIRLIQIGSGCIYFGESPHHHYLQGDGSAVPDIGPATTSWTFVYPSIKIDDGWREEDFANPISHYSKSKYACDLALNTMKHVCTLRIRMPISDRDNPRNLINKLRGYKQIIDIPNSMTFLSDLTRCVEWAVDKERSGIYHVANPEPLTAAQIMTEYKRYFPKHEFEIINEWQLDNLTLAKRSNCILDTQKLQSAGFTMTPSKEALEKTMAEYSKNVGGPYVQ